MKVRCEKPRWRLQLIVNLLAKVKELDYKGLY